MILKWGEGTLLTLYLQKKWADKKILIQQIAKNVNNLPRNIIKKYMSYHPLFQNRLLTALKCCTENYLNGLDSNI